jgi:hypothetical protein
MGWFEDKEKRTLGDAPLDALRACLLDISTEYREAIKRPPTLDEVGELLRVVLNGCDETVIGGLERKDVTQVVLTTKARPAKQSWGTGDVFSMRLPDETYAFGRVIWRQQPNKGAAVIEVFRARSKTSIPPAGAKYAGRLMAPIEVNGVLALESGRWWIIEREPTFTAPDHQQLRMFTEALGKAHVFDVEFKTVAKDVPASQVPAGAIDRDRYRTQGRLDPVEKDVLSALVQAKVEAR